MLIFIDFETYLNIYNKTVSSRFMYIIMLQNTKI